MAWYGWVLVGVVVVGFIGLVTYLVKVYDEKRLRLLSQGICPDCAGAGFADGYRCLACGVTGYANEARMRGCGVWDDFAKGKSEEELYRHRYTVQIRRT